MRHLHCNTLPYPSSARMSLVKMKFTAWLYLPDHKNDGQSDMQIRALIWTGFKGCLRSAGSRHCVLLHASTPVYTTEHRGFSMPCKPSAPIVHDTIFPFKTCPPHIDDVILHATLIRWMNDIVTPQINTNYIGVLGWGIAVKLRIRISLYIHFIFKKMPCFFTVYKMHNPIPPLIIAAIADTSR